MSPKPRSAPALPAAPRRATTERRPRRRFVVDSQIPERGTPRPWRPGTDATALGEEPLYVTVR